MQKNKDDGLNLMIGPLQPCEAILGLFIEMEERYNIEITDKEAEEIWKEWFEDRYEVTWKRSYIQEYYDGIKDKGPKYESWKRW